MKQEYKFTEDSLGGVYGMGKYAGPVPASEYKRTIHPENNPKSDIHNHSTRAKLEQRIKRKFKEKARETALEEF